MHSCWSAHLEIEFFPKQWRYLASVVSQCTEITAAAEILVASTLRATPVYAVWTFGYSVGCVKWEARANAINHFSINLAHVCAVGLTLLWITKKMRLLLVDVNYALLWKKLHTICNRVLIIADGYKQLHTIEHFTDY